MPLKKEAARQYPLIARKVIPFSEFTAAGEATAVFDLPPGSQVVGGDIVVNTVFNSTTNTLSVGDASSATRYASAVDLKSAARTALTVTGFPTTITQPSIVLTYARTGADSTAGQVTVSVLYVVNDKAHEVQG